MSIDSQRTTVLTTRAASVLLRPDRHRVADVVGELETEELVDPIGSCDRVLLDVGFRLFADRELDGFVERGLLDVEFRIGHLIPAGILSRRGAETECVLVNIGEAAVICG